MTLAQDDESPSDGLTSTGAAGSTGRERRVHHRREASRVWAQVDGGWYKVHDVSLGGLRLERPVDGPDIGGVIEGEIHSRAGNRQKHLAFRASVVRVEQETSRIGVAFTPMEAEQIDGLLAILSAVERDYVAFREAEHRVAALRRRLRRLAVIGAVTAGAAAAGYAVWFMR